MPKERTYTNAGHVEVQWAKDGQLVCLVSQEQPADPAMHQFTNPADVDRIIRHLRRARKQAFGHH